MPGLKDAREGGFEMTEAGEKPMVTPGEGHISCGSAKADRAPASGAVGRGFKSLRARQQYQRSRSIFPLRITLTVAQSYPSPAQQSVGEVSHRAAAALLDLEGVTIMRPVKVSTGWRTI